MRVKGLGSPERESERERKTQRERETYKHREIERERETDGRTDGRTEKEQERRKAGLWVKGLRFRVWGFSVLEFRAFGAFRVHRFSGLGLRVCWT